MRRAIAVLLICACAYQPLAHCKLDWDKYDQAGTWWKDYVVGPEARPLQYPELFQSEEGEELAGSKRRLQQLFNVPEVAPFTFDGFAFGLGGYLPLNQGTSAYSTLLNNVFFRNIFNGGLGQFIGQGLSNSVDLTRYLPKEVMDVLNDDVVTLLGYDAVDRFIGQYLTLPSAKAGSRIPAGCIGPIYSLVVDGGSCEIKDNGSVECSQPTIKFKSTPLVCNLPYRSACSLKGKTFRFNIKFGRPRSGEIGPPAGVYNFGAALNVTRLFLGYNAATRRVLNDFGVQNWYNYLSNFAQIELLRIRAALVSGQADEGWPIGHRRHLLQGGKVLTEGEAQLKQGVQELSAATSNLAGKISERLGVKNVLDPKSMIQQLLGRGRSRLSQMSSRGKSAAAIGQDAKKVAAKTDPFIGLKEAGVPLDGQGTQKYVEALGSNMKAEGNPYLLQTKYAKSNTARGMPQQQQQRTAATNATAAPGEKAAVTLQDQGIIAPAAALTPEQRVAADAKAVLGSAADAAPLQEMMQKQQGVDVKTSVVEEGNQSLLGTAQMG